MKGFKGFCQIALVFLLVATLAGCQSGMTQATSSGQGQSEGVKWVGTYVDGEGKTGIRGRVVLKEDNSPLAGSYVNIYPDTISNLLGPSQFISTPTDEQGFYQLEIVSEPDFGAIGPAL